MPLVLSGLYYTNEGKKKKTLNTLPTPPPPNSNVSFSYNNCKKTVCPNELLHLRLNGLLIFYHKMQKRKATSMQLVQ